MSDAATIRERPVIFSGPMVRAILDGTKTQTRRVLKHPPAMTDLGTGETVGVDRVAFEVPGVATFYAPLSAPHPETGNRAGPMWTTTCPYGKPGDRLWVRETFAIMYQVGRRTLSCLVPSGRAQREALRRPVYRATAKNIPINLAITWRPSIFMPRWASRITLEITEVRVQRLQEISEEDAQAEGAGTAMWGSDVPGRHAPLLSTENHRAGFAALWDSINGKRPGCAWNNSPWVWAISFKRITETA